MVLEKISMIMILHFVLGVTSARVWFGNTLNSDGAKFFIDR